MMGEGIAGTLQLLLQLRIRERLKRLEDFSSRRIDARNCHFCQIFSTRKS